MAIDLPPVIPPQLSTAERIEAYAPAGAETVTATIQNKTLRITGNRYLTDEQLRRILDNAETPSQAIRAINQAYYNLGHLLVTVYYAPQGETVLVHVINAGLAEVEAPKKIRVHFAGLIGDEELTVSEFDAKRILADVKSQREGVDYKISYQVKEGNPEAYTMVFTPEPVEDHDATDLILQMSNEGNRFIGRYFAGAGFQHQFDTGSELSLMFEKVVVGLGENDGGKSYDSIELQFDHPSRFGLYGLEASYIEYEREATFLEPAGPPTGSTQGTICDVGGLLGLPCEDIIGDIGTQRVQRDLKSKIGSVALTGEQVVYSDRSQRFTVAQRLEAIETEIETEDGEEILDEPHAALELGGKYSRRMRPLGVSTQLSLQLFVKGGFTGDDGTLGTDDVEEAVSAGKRTGEFLLLRPKLGLKFALGDAATFNINAVGQISDDDQLPQQQQFVLGGMDSLSAYLPGVLVGDTGAYSLVSLDGNGWDFWGINVVPSLFVEYGRVRFENAGGDPGEARSVSDGGLRLKADLGWQTSMEFVAAEPISENNIDKAALEEREVDFFWKLKKRF